MTRLGFLSAWFVGAALVSCGPRGGTDVGNGAAISVNLRALEVPRGEDDPRKVELASGVRVDSVWIAVERLELEAGKCGGGGDDDGPDGGPSGGDVVRYDDRAIADLTGDGVVGERPAFDAPSGAYCRLRLRLHRVKGDDVPPGAPQELADRSIVIRGTRADGVPFLVASKVNVNFRLDAPTSSFDLEGDEALILAFDLESLIDALELDEHDGPSIVIDDDSDPPTVARFDKALRRAVSLFRDTNADGALSASESAPSLVIAAGTEAD